MSSLLAQRAASEGPRSTRVVEDNRRPPPKRKGTMQSSEKNAARCPAQGEKAASLKDHVIKLCSSDD